jgi:hypothetical protein
MRRGRDDRDAGGQPGGERVDRAGIDLPEQLSGQRRAAAAPDGAREAADQAGSGRFGREANSHAFRAYPEPQNDPEGGAESDCAGPVLPRLHIGQNDLK